MTYSSERSLVMLALLAGYTFSVTKDDEYGQELHLFS